MIGYMQKHEIIQRHLAGDSNRKIARDMKIDRKTVNKYVGEYDELQLQLECSDDLTVDGIRNITEKIVAAPAYRTGKRPARKWDEEMDAFLDAVLASEDEKKRRLKTRKQMLSSVQIHEMMVSEGYDISLSTVRRKIDSKRAVAEEAYIAQGYDFGQRFEYDFGEVQMEIAGRFCKLQMAVMTADASGYRFAVLYDNQKFGVFVDSQVRFFEHMGGCFAEGVYDNMRNAVARFTGPNEKEANPGLTKLAAYYCFRVVLTNTRAGWEKGHVENAVKVIRNRAFAVRWRFGSVEEAQAHLDGVLADLNEGLPVDEERAALSVRKPPYESADVREGANVDKYSCVTVDGNSCSVPDVLVGKKVTVKSYPDDVVVTVGGKVVAHHAKLRGTGGMRLDIAHNLETLERKPGALANCQALRALPALKKIFDEHYTERPREFVRILRESGTDGAEAALLAAATAEPNAVASAIGNAIAEQARAQMAAIIPIGRRSANAV